MQDSNSHPHNPWYNQDHSPWSPPPIPPRIITGPAHAITFIASLMAIADAATLQAANLLEADDLYLAAANVECGTMYLHIAEPVIVEYVQDLGGLAALGESQQKLTVLQNQIIQKAGQYPLYDEPISCLRTYAQAILMFPQLQILHQVLASQGQTMSNWDSDHEEAHISTAQFLAYQPPFSSLENILNPRPDLAEESEAVRVQGQDLADRITQGYLADMPISLSPAAIATPGITTRPNTGPLSPAFPRFGIQFTEDSKGGSETPVPYMTFVYHRTIYLKTINEPYPKDFPQSLAQDYADAAADTILPALDPENEEITLHQQYRLNTMVETMQDAAKLGMHTATPTGLRAIVKTARDIKLPRGAQITVLSALTDFDDDLAATVLQDPAGAWRKRVTKKQALKLLQAARQQDIDPYTMREIADAIGYEPEELGIKIPALNKQQFDVIVEAVARAGLPKSAANRVLEALL